MKLSEMIKLVEDNPTKEFQWKKKSKNHWKPLNVNNITGVSPTDRAIQGAAKISSEYFSNNYRWFEIRIKPDVWECKTYGYTIDKVDRRVPINGQTNLNLPALSTDSLNKVEAYAKLLNYVEEFESDTSIHEPKYSPLIRRGRTSFC